MFTALKAACDRGGPLVGVREMPLFPGSGSISAIELQFQELTVTLSAVEDDDTVSISLAPLAQPTPVGYSAHWDQCLGNPLRWAWLMTNQQGYIDGLRLEFGGPDDSQPAVLELVVAASSFSTFIARATKG
jgi:hypothetical protein